MIKIAFEVRNPPHRFTGRAENTGLSKPPTITFYKKDGTVINPPNREFYNGMLNSGNNYDKTFKLENITKHETISVKLTAQGSWEDEERSHGFTIPSLTITFNGMIYSFTTVNNSLTTGTVEGVYNTVGVLHNDDP